MLSNLCCYYIWNLAGRGLQPNAIKLRNFIGIQTVRLWIIWLKYQTLPNLKVWTPMLNLMVVGLQPGC